MNKKNYQTIKIQAINYKNNYIVVKYKGDYLQLQIQVLPVIKTLLNKIKELNK